jgi:hypothetical protein
VIAERSARPLTLAVDGAEIHRGGLARTELDDLRTLADEVLDGGSGVRLFGGPVLHAVLSERGTMGRIARKALGPAARAVRAVMFDKTEATNWAVHWHQDRTIAVKERRDVAGFGPWTVKTGVPHVEPPFEIIASMVTLRAHLDNCDAANAPLLIAPGSHKCGRVPESEIRRTVSQLGHATCLAAAGDVWLYSTAIVHASERARIPRRRRVLQVDFAEGDLPAGLHWLGIDKDSSAAD